MLTGCSSKAKEPGDLKWFNSEEKAIAYGLQDEEIKENDVLEMLDLNGERFVVYKFKVPEGEGINVVQIAKKNKKYSWYTIANRIIVKSKQGKLDANVEIESKKGQQFKLYTGVVKDPEKSDELIEKEGITPIIDQEAGLYYAIKSLK
ncbi:hypothetical protein [Rummeliibacillus sp. POC4]|uniref:hypothetical protein n=1 Tax=Rummeliibacillus sp. POC4 TaxID=2305899 RepID=UPI000E66D29F|nr:hypothetical protein [Rummeliibacillus sp. POC4]RIJ63518.1 hypothetical protein D1606_14555 [Rummeliibacillus sp. POC4]